MGKALALARASWLTASSYRLNMILSIVSLLVMVVSLYFVATALQPVMADAIDSEGGQYFGFLIVGMIALSCLTTAVTALPSALGSSITSGTLEALLSTRARIPELLAGMVGYAFVWTGIRGVLLLTGGWALGAPVAWERWPLALVILALIVLAYLPFGLLAAAMVLAFRTAGPLPQAVLVLSGLLGGVYYPTHVIPSWIQHLSAVVPLTYGLRALRQATLEHAPVGALLADLTVLLGFVLVLFISSGYVFFAALRYARRSGTLSQY